MSEEIIIHSHKKPTKTDIARQKMRYQMRYQEQCATKIEVSEKKCATKSWEMLKLLKAIVQKCRKHEKKCLHGCFRPKENATN